MVPVNFAFVWKEEQEILSKLACQVPENGTIIEIGTAIGGTAMIFHQSVAKKGVKIYTVDALDCKRAKINLTDTDVEIITQPSHEFAKLWKNNLRKPIDMLYIDGDHNFYSIYTDFNEWFPLVAPDGIVAFHDYDPIERGGLVHFGVKICLDTLINKGLLCNAQHNYKILSGIKVRGCEAFLDWKDCYLVFLKIVERIITIREEIFKNGIHAGLEILRKRSLSFNSVEACYCIDYALKKDFEYLDSLTNAFYDFRRCTELLSVLEHANAITPFHENCMTFTFPETALQLSQLIAREQARVFILALILKTIVPWEP